MSDSDILRRLETLNAIGVALSSERDLRRLLEHIQLFVRHRPRSVRADGFEDILNAHVVALERSGHDGPTVEHE